MIGNSHFSPQLLTDKVFAAIAQEGGAAISNAGFMDLGGLVVVFDTFLTLQAAREMRTYLEAVFGQPPKIVVNSHHHNDHTWGNQVFLPEAQFISSSEARRLMLTDGMEEYKWYSANSKQRLEALQAQFNNTKDATERRRLLLWIGYYNGLAESMPQLEVVLPSITFESRLELYGSQRRAELVAFHGAHTGNDTILFLPDDGIVFTSDLLFINNHPYLPEGDPFKLLDVLRELSRMEARTYIPGHGPVGTRDDLFAMIEYVEDCLATARALVREGGDYEERVKELQLPDRYSGWQLSGFYPTNIQFLCRQLESQIG